ncbi:zinc finger BED domain-containing protein RICESLEEPER 2-like [Ananas comosus]|uniref:Zinc finger BED domain-containing protein RICESLEEPER 2-like n=1 Tax=Ananas comosus TaxID=4615 RepID=A0A6P5GFP9_ANACO|nr:zinc finger BED domain-containing protein RICESLEEPER 2-like [Ananas comosus]
MDSEHVQIVDENNNCETQQPDNIQTTVKQERVSDSDSARKKPRKYSDVWNSFDTYVDDDGNNRARCILCKASYAIEGLKVSSMALHKIRESIKYLKSSEARLIKFAELAKQTDVTTSMHLRMDICTRWNSTYLMLENAVTFRRVFMHYSLFDSHYKYCPSNDELDRAERIGDFLEPFYEITTLLSGSEYPTANLYFPSVWKIQKRLLEEAESEDEIISDMAKQMKSKFEKYWDNYNVILAIAIILDPRYKLPFVDYCFKKVYPTRYLEDAQGRKILTSQEKDFDGFDNEFGVTSKSELDRYLEETKFDRIQHAKLNILDFLKDNCVRYPILSKMARDIMSIPITTVASESAFSIGNEHDDNDLVVPLLNIGETPESRESTTKATDVD